MARVEFQYNRIHQGKIITLDRQRWEKYSPTATKGLIQGRWNLPKMFFRPSNDLVAFWNVFLFYFILFLILILDKKGL